MKWTNQVDPGHRVPVAAGRLQAMHLGANGSVYRDVDHDGLGLVVELDGRIFHTSVTDRDRDLERDLDVVVERDATTVRLGFGQVFARSCATAAKLGLVMSRLGWPDQPTRCALCGGSNQPG